MSVPNDPNTAMILQQIFDQISALRNELSSDFVRKDLHDTDIGNLQKQLDGLEAKNDNKLSKWFTGISIVSLVLNVVLTLHGLKVF